MYKAQMLKAGTLKTGVSILLLTQSMVLQAVPTVTSADESVKESAVESVTGAAIKPAKETTGNEQQAAGSQTGNFPNWSKHQRVVEELTPPPPPGPYMSTAMNDHTIRGRSFAHKMNRPVRRTESSALSMDTFSPDRPWPKNLRPAKRWKPEKSYHYANPSAMGQNKQSRTNYGYRPGHGMNMPGNWPTMNTSGPGWMPSMNRGSGGSSQGHPYPGKSYHGNSYYGKPHPGNTNKYSVRRDNHPSSGYQSGGHHRQNSAIKPAPYPPQGRP